MRAQHFLCFFGQKFGTSKMQLSPTATLAAIRSKAVVLLLVSRC